jgi:hypothetical protein
LRIVVYPSRSALETDCCGSRKLHRHTPDAAVPQEKGALEQASELPDIARPGVAPKCVEERRSPPHRCRATTQP